MAYTLWEAQGHVRKGVLAQGCPPSLLWPSTMLGKIGKTWNTAQFLQLACIPYYTRQEFLIGGDCIFPRPQRTFDNTWRHFDSHDGEVVTGALTLDKQRNWSYLVLRTHDKEGGWHEKGVCPKLHCNSICRKFLFRTCYLIVWWANFYHRYIFLNIMVHTLAAIHQNH